LKHNEQNSTKKKMVEAKGDTIVFTFGRFQPPTSGHQLLIDKVASVASRVRGTAMVFPSAKEGDAKNPIKHKDKVKFMKKAFRNVEIVDNSSIHNPFAALKWMSDRGVAKVIMVVGSDRVKEFENMVKPYINGKDPKTALNFEFEVVSAGNRDPDATDVSGVSGSKVRQFAADGDWDSFSESMPSSASNAEKKKIYNALRKSAGVREAHDPISFGKLRKKSGKLTVVVLTKQGDDELKGTAEKLEKACKTSGISFYPILVDKAYVADEDATDNSLIIHNYDGDNRKVKLNVDNTVVFVRGSAIVTHGGLGLVQVFEQAGAFVINSAEAMRFCQNKLATALSFERHGIPSPRTAFVNNEESIDLAVKKIGGKFPMIVKTLTGAEGIGVSKVESYESLKSVLQSLWKFDAELIIQEYMEIKFDVRTLVLNGKIIASAKRMKGGKDFRTNKSLGNETKPHKLSQEEKDFVHKVSKMSGCYLCGVDHITVNGKLYALEINGSPGSGMDGYQSYYVRKGVVTGQDLTNHIIDYISDRDNWVFSSRDVGYIEWVEIGGEKVKAKLDTGNGSWNALHAENIEVKGNKVSFDLFGKKRITKPVHEVVDIHVGAGERRDRQVVKMDMTINGTKYTDVEFSLADRDENVYEVLLGKKFLEILNYSVNVNKKFTLDENEFPKARITLNTLDSKWKSILENESWSLSNQRGLKL